MVEEARLERPARRFAPVTEGWFVVSVPEAAWVTNEALGAACIFEGDDVSFPEVRLHHRRPPAGAGEQVPPRGEPGGLPRPLRRVPAPDRGRGATAEGVGDFVHCPANTDLGFVGAGDGPCVIFMTGAREGWPEKGIVYPRGELALRHGTGVETETT
jgi:hypothetical protein